MVPRLIGVAVVQLNFVVNTIIATSLVEGSLTSIKYAWAIMTMPQVIIAQAIAIAALPTFSAQVALGKLTDMRSSLSATLRGVVLLSLPATFGLIILRSPIISMLFERGEFDATSTQMVAWALLWYAVGLVGHSLVEITSRAFYALHDTKTPVVIGTIAMSMNVLFSFLFSRLFAQIGWQPFGGLAFANSLATSMEMVALLFLMHRRLHGLNGKDLLRGIIKTAVATLAMSWMSRLVTAETIRSPLRLRTG
jgi:putative peptidoglycan lipid II flippase